MTEGAPEIVVLGDALLDVVVSPMQPIRAGADVPAAIGIGPGGQGANLAVRLARQGVRVELICGLGDDPAATLIRDGLHAEGIVLSSVPVAASGMVVILLDEHGERTMLSHRAPFAALAGAASPDVASVVVSGYLLLEPDAVELMRTLAARRGRRVVAGCGLSPASAPGWMANLAALHPDLLVLNRDEAALLAGDGRPAELSRRLSDRLGAAVVVTDPTACVAALPRGTISVRSPAGTTALDATGAGDAFAATLVAGLRNAPWPPSGPSLEAAMTAAAELATAVAGTAGAQGNVSGERPATLRR